ncbi:MAG: SUMF1/EgtB/PvdO family nonheme iron enzyme [Thermoguttaceae bacterium]
MAETFDPYHRWLGISPKDQPPNHYRLLGIDRFEGDPEVIRDAAEQRIGHVRRYQLGKHQATSQRILNELAAAKACLLNPEKKTAYDTQLREKTAAERSEDRPQAMAEGIAELETHARPVATGPLAPPEETPSLEWLVQGVRGSEQAPRARTAAKPGTARAAKKRGLARAFERMAEAVRRTTLRLIAAVACAAAAVILVALAYSLLTGKSQVANDATIAKLVGDSIREDSRAAGAARSRSQGSPEAIPAAATQSTVGDRDSPPLAIAPFDAAKAREHQDAWAKHLGVPVVATNTIGMKLILVPPGEFMMGSPPELIEKEKREHGNDKWYLEHLSGEGPAHRVWITKPFRLGMFHVTQEEYQRVMGSNPGEFSVTGKWKDKIAGQDTRRFPVENVSWNDAAEFCQRLGPKEGKEYRLPTEAEWEYACRAGTTTAWSFGDDESNLGSYGWFQSNSNGTTHPVGQKQPNSWGLFDMHGNMWEWCADWYGKDYYGASPVDDPAGPSSGSARVLRGVSWNDWPPISRSAIRNGDRSDLRIAIVGFRVAGTP